MANSDTSSKENDDWKPFKTDLNEDLKCGFVSLNSLLILDELSPEEVRRLAAMAVTCFDSPWSDRLKDLLRGVSCLLSREEHNRSY